MFLHIRKELLLRSCSEGSAYPNDVSSTATLAPDHDAQLPHITPSIGQTILARISRAEELNDEHPQQGCSWALPGRPPALCWTTRQQWLIAVHVFLLTDEGRRRCRSLGIAPATVRAIARACAAFADSKTGRGVSASNQTLGAWAAAKARRARPWKRDVVSKARKCLSAAGLAVEVARGRYLTAEERLAASVHHDGVQIRAASVWALVLPRRWAVKSYLPRRGPTGSKPPRRYTSPKRARTRAKAPSGRSLTDKGPSRTRAAHVVTAQLVAEARSLDTGRHLGALVDVVADLVHCDRWTGRDLVTVLNEDARNTPRDWPSTIQNPAGFLRHRLIRITDRLAGPSPSEIVADHAARVRAEQEARRQEQQDAQARAASPDTVRARMAEIRTTLQQRRHARTATGTPKLTRTQRLKGENEARPTMDRPGSSRHRDR